MSVDYGPVFYALNNGFGAIPYKIMSKNIIFEATTILYFVYLCKKYSTQTRFKKAIINNLWEHTSQLLQTGWPLCFS
jgi:hypothetical protein